MYAEIMYVDWQKKSCDLKHPINKVYYFWVAILRLFLFKWANSGLFYRLFLVISNKQFHKNINVKNDHSNTVPGFNPTTLVIWASSHNHWTRAPDLILKLLMTSARGWSLQTLLFLSTLRLPSNGQYTRPYTNKLPFYSCHDSAKISFTNY